MEFGQVNYLAVLVAGVVGFVVGPLWYGPMFGKTWLELSGIKTAEGEKQPMTPFIFTLIGFLFLAYAIARIMSFGNLTGIWWGVVIAFLLWLMVIAPLMLSQTLYYRQSLKLWGIDVSYRGVSILIMGLIIGLWS